LLSFQREQDEKYFDVNAEGVKFCIPNSEKEFTTKSIGKVNLDDLVTDSSDDDHVKYISTSESILTSRTQTGPIESEDDEYESMEDDFGIEDEGEFVRSIPPMPTPRPLRLRDKKKDQEKEQKYQESTTPQPKEQKNSLLNLTHSQVCDLQ